MTWAMIADEGDQITLFMGKTVRIIELVFSLLGSKSENSGAWVPKGSIVEEVATIELS